MSLYLALDTATELASVTIGTPSEVRADITVGGRRHAAALVPAIDTALRLASVGLGELTGTIVSDGPGSFTGLRIGFATVQGLRREHAHLVVRTAPSLLATAFMMHRVADGPVAAMYDALRGEVFAAVYRFTSERVIVVREPERTRPEELIRTTTASLAVGDGALAHADLVRRWTGRAPVGPPNLPSAGIGLLGLLALPGATRPIEDFSAFEPHYGRLAEAQVRWERSHGRPLAHPPSEPS